MSKCFSFFEMVIFFLQKPEQLLQVVSAEAFVSKFRGVVCGNWKILSTMGTDATQTFQGSAGNLAFDSG